MSHSCGVHKILDATFYDDNTISLLLHESSDDKTNTSRSVLCQMCLDVIEDDRFTVVPPGTMLHQFQNM